MEKLKVGVIGCGNISPIHLKNMATLFGNPELWAVADFIAQRAEARSREFAVPNVRSVSELLDDPEIDFVLNLTPPPAHAELCSAAIAAGKHVYVEKPLSISLADGKRLVAQAEAAGRCWTWGRTI